MSKMYISRHLCDDHAVLKIQTEAGREISISFRKRSGDDLNADELVVFEDKASNKIVGAEIYAPTPEELLDVLRNEL